MTVQLEEILHLSERLTPEDKQLLIQHLQATLPPKRPSLQLLEFDVVWPDHLTLRREDEYDNDGR